MDELVIIGLLAFLCLFGLGIRALEREFDAHDRFVASRNVELEKRVAKLEQSQRYTG